MDSAKPTRRHCFIEEDDGLASLADMEAGFSGNSNYPLVSRPLYYNTIQRRSSLRSLSSPSSGFVSSPRSANSTLRFYEEPHHPHFLEACFLCKKPLGGNRDIFMYRLVHTEIILN